MTPERERTVQMRVRGNDLEEAKEEGALGDGLRWYEADRSRKSPEEQEKLRGAGEAQSSRRSWHQEEDLLVAQ